MAALVDMLTKGGHSADDPVAVSHVALQDAKMVEFSGHSYALTIGSDIQRDGMYLEVADDTKTVLVEVFYSDIDNSMTFTGYREYLPLPFVEWVIACAKERLMPASNRAS